MVGAPCRASSRCCSERLWAPVNIISYVSQCVCLCVSVCVCVCVCECVSVFGRRRETERERERESECVHMDVSVGFVCICVCVFGIRIERERGKERGEREREREREREIVCAHGCVCGICHQCGVQTAVLSRPQRALRGTGPVFLSVLSLVFKPTQ